MPQTESAAFQSKRLLLNTDTSFLELWEFRYSVGTGAFITSNRLCPCCFISSSTITAAPFAQSVNGDSSTFAVTDRTLTIPMAAPTIPAQKDFPSPSTLKR